MTASELWSLFQREKGINISEYEAWAFGGAPDELAELVIKGTKKATTSLYYWYEDGKERLPQVGSYSVVLDSKENAVCIIQTTKVYIVPFCEVSKEHALKEGEGDLSLAYWQRVHEEFFSSELESEKINFSDKLRVVCEEFKLIFIAHNNVFSI